MARTELDTKKQKRKAKKRKHDTQPTGSDDEVADKSLIVEEQQGESETHMEEEATKKVKATKRKQKVEHAVVKEKRSKPTNDSKEDATNDEEVEDLPTKELLAEAAKPENSNAVVTVRQKKKQKHLKRLEEKKYQSSDKEAKRNEEYLLKWRDSRQDWKFVKLRQISIQQTAFDEKKLSSDVWPIALEYLAASKGASKTTISKLAQDVIEEMDKKCEEVSDDAERQAIVESTRYQRARNLLQSFD